jgi:hypothetical protein
MKRIVLAFFGLAIMSAAANAQTEKGTVLLGGDVAFTSVESTSAFSLAPNVGFFVANNFAVGGQFSLYTSEGYTSWGVGPFARYYFSKNQNGKPFVGASLLIGGDDNTDTQVGFGAKAGYALFLNKSIALEFGLTYNRLEGVDMIGIGAGFQIHFKKK